MAFRSGSSKSQRMFFVSSRSHSILHCTDLNNKAGSRPSGELRTTIGGWKFAQPTLGGAVNFTVGRPVGEGSQQQLHSALEKINQRGHQPVVLVHHAVAGVN